MTKANQSAILCKNVCFLLAMLVLGLSPQAASADEQRTGLLPFALSVFSFCMDASLESRQLTDKHVLSFISPLLEGFSGPEDASLSVETGENFECSVTIPAGGYSPTKLRETLEEAQASGFDGRVDRCAWSLVARNSILSCVLRSKSDPANSFQVLAGLVPNEGAFFWIKPTLIFDKDGYVKIVE